MKYLRKFWGWLKSPFNKVEATEEVVDRQTNAVVQYRRPEEMRIMRWTANAGYAFKEDVHATQDTLVLVSPALLWVYAGLAYIWVISLMANVFGLAWKGAAISLILAKAVKVTYVMAVVGLVITVMYFGTIGVGWLLLRVLGRVLNKATGRKVSWLQAMYNTTQRAMGNMAPA